MERYRRFHLERTKTSEEDLRILMPTSREFRKVCEKLLLKRKNAATVVCLQDYEEPFLRRLVSRARGISCFAYKLTRKNCLLSSRCNNFESC